MPGIRALRKINLGTESTGTPGTAVPATTALRMTGTIEDMRETVFPVEDIGIAGGDDRSYVPKLGAGINTDGEFTFEQGPYILEAGVEQTTSTTDTGSGFIYTFNVFTTVQKNPQTYTIEGGDDQEAEEVEYCFVKDFTLSGNAGEAWKVSANWFGRQCSTTTFTPSTDAPIPTVETCLFSKTKLYIDETTDTIGTTQKSATMLSAEIKAITGFQEIPVGDGNLYFASHKQVAPEIIATLTFEHDGSATAEKAKWRAGTARQIKLLCEGTALASAGVYTYKSFIINLVGKWEKFDKLDEQDGNDIVKGTFRARYDSTAALFASFVVVNELSALP